MGSLERGRRAAHFKPPQRMTADRQDSVGGLPVSLLGCSSEIRPCSRLGLSVSLR